MSDLINLILSLGLILFLWSKCLFLIAGFLLNYIGIYLSVEAVMCLMGLFSLRDDNFVKFIDASDFDFDKIDSSLI